jgi:hypothetical protein
MHFLLPICGKFTRALLAHQIFSNREKVDKNDPICEENSSNNFDRGTVYTNHTLIENSNESFVNINSPVFAQSMHASLIPNLFQLQRDRLVNINIL